MELRIDRLLNRLRTDPERLLGMIDADPLLLKREVDGMVLANATKELFTPREEHQLFAKGIVFQRNPYRLVSLPLLKIHNLGEKEVTVHDLSAMTHEGATVSFLRKFDGSMIQRFQKNGRVYFTTRGMLEGVNLPNPNNETHFDYLGAARQIAARQFPDLLVVKPEWDELTFVMELIHPEGRVITDYGNREDLILLTVFDRRDICYWPHRRTHQFALEHGLKATEILDVQGSDLISQIDHMLSMMAGTDEEGSVINFESSEVLYRVKVKSPDYLRLLKLMVHCTYDATVEILRQCPHFPSWQEFEEILKSRGSDKVPEEVLGVYCEHYERYRGFCVNCDKIREWSDKRTSQIVATISETEPRAKRRIFAGLVAMEPLKALLFASMDGRLTWEKVAEHFDRPEEAIRVVADLN